MSVFTMSNSDRKGLRPIGENIIGTFGWDVKANAPRGEGDDQVREAIMLGGPTGAGKTTAAASLLPDALGIREFVNADEIGRGLSPFNPKGSAVAAGRLMIERMRALAHAGDPDRRVMERIIGPHRAQPWGEPGNAKAGKSVPEPEMVHRHLFENPLSCRESTHASDLIATAALGRRLSVHSRSLRLARPAANP